MSPWTQIESGRSVIEPPSTSSIGSPDAIATHRCAMVAASWSTAPWSRRETSVPSGVYARSANASCTVVRPACSAWRSHTEPGRPSTGSVRSWTTIASTTAAACSSWWTIAL